MFVSLTWIRVQLQRHLTKQNRNSCADKEGAAETNNSRGMRINKVFLLMKTKYIHWIAPFKPTK